MRGLLRHHHLVSRNSCAVRVRIDLPLCGITKLTLVDHNFDLFERRKGWKAEDVLVVTPYVEQEFFQRLVKGLRPRRLSVIIDDGCRMGDVAMVQETVAKAHVSTAAGLACVLGSAPGLMHLKLFYIVWRTPGRRTARTLIFGSARHGSHCARLRAPRKAKMPAISLGASR